MNEQLLAALAAAADVMRRSDPVYTAVMDVKPTSDVEWDDCLALLETALENAENVSQAK